MGFLVRLVIQAIAIWLATYLLSGLTVTGGDSTGITVLVFLGVALVFSLVNAIVKPIVKVLSLPLYLLTLGLFGLVVNALMLMLVGWLSEQTSYGLRVDNFGTAVIGALIIAVANVVLTALVPAARKKG
ncbi:MAG: phage holin family protein [Actinomycetales bacterium]|nr:phage holin family protein [Actinomycetales bacterium]